MKRKEYKNRFSLTDICYGTKQIGKKENGGGKDKNNQERGIKKNEKNRENVHAKSGLAQPRRAGARAHHQDNPSPCLQAVFVPNVGTWEPALG